MTSLKTWFEASRPFSFTAAVVPAVVGSLLQADVVFSWWKAVLAVLGSIFFLAGTNFVNDYFDDRKGADGQAAYRRLKNRTSIDGLPAFDFDPEPDPVA